MSYFFDASTKSFFSDALSVVPRDAKKISDALYQAMQNRAQDEVVDAGGDGFPCLIKLEAVSENVIAIACTPAQGLVALFALKQITEDHVLDAISQIPDPVQQYTARIGYQRATTWERGSPTMQAMAQLLQLSDQDLDELFTHAVTVQV